MKQRCRAITKKGQFCKNEGILKGYCIIHYSIKYKEDKTNGKTKTN